MLFSVGMQEVSIDPFGAVPSDRTLVPFDELSFVLCILTDLS